MSHVNLKILVSAKAVLDALVEQYSWKLWATDVCNGSELLAIVEVRQGKIIKIKSGANTPHFMVEGESGWSDIHLLPEVRNFKKFQYQVSGDGRLLKYSSREELEADYQVVGYTSGDESRIELRWQPRIQGISGPMYGGYDNGCPIIRYEV